MTTAIGEVAYQKGAIPCSGTGISWSSDELDKALTERVAPLVFDDEGKTDIKAILGGLAETEFDQDGLRETLADPDNVEDWRVGEAIAGAYLNDHRNCEFPWPIGRDERKRGSSLPGADLVGFQTDDGGDCFAFGEVKSSSEEKYPPSVVYGRTGLKQQIENLRDNNRVRDSLITYLCHRTKEASWKPRFERASRRYLENKSDVYLYGILVRDVEPNEDDLRMLVVDLAESCPDGTTIEFLAFYLPQGRITGIGASIVAQRMEADT